MTSSAEKIPVEPAPAASATARRRPKIVFTGSVGVGKTTALKAISDIPPVTTDERSIEDDVLAIKETTTVAMDYGALILASGAKVDLYATPGQERFSFMWDILGKNSAGLVLLLDMTRPDPMKDLHFYLERFLPIIKDAPMVIGLSKVNEDTMAAAAQVPGYLKTLSRPIPSMAVDARDARQVKRLVLSLLLLIDPQVLR